MEAGAEWKSAWQASGRQGAVQRTAMAHLLDDWTAHGPSVLARVRQDDPSTYLRVAFNTIPKDVQIAIEQRNGPLDTNEMRLMRRLVDMIDAVGASGAAEPETVLAWIEEDLRASLALPVEQTQPKSDPDDNTDKGSN
jgi:hypothetical protein